MPESIIIVMFVAGGLAFYSLTAFLSERYSPLVVIGAILLAGAVWGLLS